MKTSAFLLGLALLAAALHAAPPNIVIILTDDQGRGDYSAFGTKDLRTPNIDRIFREGMELTNFRANCPVCSPTRAALLTGCYPDRVGVPGVIREEEPQNSWGHLSPDAVLLPKLLKPLGYDTALVGKWHLGLTSPNLPHERGFDSARAFLGDMMDDYLTHLRHGQNFMRENSQAVEPQSHATEVFTGWACDYLRSRRDAKAPFFLYLAYNAPHDPIQPPRASLEKVLGREPGLDSKRAALVALIEHLDAGIGQVLATLDETGLAPDTLLIFTSDNGGSLRTSANNGPWRSGKEHMYEGGLRVPFAARWPGRIPAGSQHEADGVTMDIFATALDVAGGPPAPGVDAVSLAGVLTGREKALPPRDLYFVRREGGPAYGGKTIEALKRGPWKLLQDSPFAPLELYNLADDPLETNDLVAKRPAIVRDLSAALRSHIQRGGCVGWLKQK